MVAKSQVILLVLVLLGPSSFGIPPAKQLLSYDYQSETFILSEDALLEIEALPGPVKIISAIGDSRVGKSTILNFIRYFLDVNAEQRVQKVFKTSNGMAPCTRGVWMSVLRDSNGAGSTILIDTEGTNQEDNAVTDLLSIFTVLMSSGLALFARDGLRNHNIEFLYRVSRLSEQIWKTDAQRPISYPKLMVILRGALSPSPGKTLQAEIQDIILDEKGRYGQIIGRYFPRNRIMVRDIPFVQDSRRLHNLEPIMINGDEYANVASSLAAELERFPWKKSAFGGTVDGKMLAELARKLQFAMNHNSWSGFSNTYIALETSLCDRSYREIIEPLLRTNVEEIKFSVDQVMNQFAEKCAVKEEINFARERISNVMALRDKIKATRRRLEEQRRRQEEEVKEEREREAERRRIALEREQKLQEEQKTRQKAEEKLKMLSQNLQRAEEERRRLLTREVEIRRQRKDMIGSAVGGAMLFGVLSDSRLKENITVVLFSEFQEIGLQGYSWVWSKKATEELGMSGIEHGVIAQEVEKLYPWAVMTSDDGYKRVKYEALRRLVLLVKKEREFYMRKHSHCLR